MRTNNNTRSPSVSDSIVSLDVPSVESTMAPGDTDRDNDAVTHIVYSLGEGACSQNVMVFNHIQQMISHDMYDYKKAAIHFLSGLAEQNSSRSQFLHGFIQDLRCVFPQNEQLFPLDNFLLADVAAGQQRKSAYDEALAKLKQKSGTSDYYKRDLIYAQLHHCRATGGSGQMLFHFFDAPLPILSTLHKYFSTNAHLIPKNITLCLHRIDFFRGRYEPYLRIMGTGEFTAMMSKNNPLSAKIRNGIWVRAQEFAANKMLTAQLPNIKEATQENLESMIDFLHKNERRLPVKVDQHREILDKITKRLKDYTQNLKPIEVTAYFLLRYLIVALPNDQDSKTAFEQWKNIKVTDHDNQTFGQLFSNSLQTKEAQQSQNQQGFFSDSTGEHHSNGEIDFVNALFTGTHQPNQPVATAPPLAPPF